ncbi:phosphoenolpyruvate synthase [Candidatus Woesearchaeota archaeon]|jgi:pyruvate, water dikinase|nr:phosphoenolpyruvate synthase [Candidatus Woesearchaeota archaeon]MBT3304785.1 phosphoenolpyruvate synthase [Candidatus Woesearchaeota archaeon]MBT4367879.1 phosphoenolpyruvate synthase [Candidatus Woesearchaeota archaeon]MBT4712367.1 phosphoenolpyruvate synthase [Candidatus Woesearchaeota archaeon]MBT6639279.1 phosphoenolpyruvate synthase [Candidatus Woesearchaeota archaeon]
MKKESKLVLWFNELSIGEVPIVGGKNASLGEMYRELKKKHVNVPNGFAITAEAYRFLLRSNDAEKKVKSILKGLNTKNLRNLQRKGDQVRTLIRSLIFPDELKFEIAKAYKRLEKEYGKNCDTAVRSSATAEDLPDASFAGQQETFLNIRGINNLLESCKHCFASLFTNRAISYREDKGFDHFKVALSIGVQKMVRSDLASSGVMFSIDTESGFKNAAFITAAYGLGETVVQGSVNPDEYYVFKPTLNKFKPIIKKKVGEKKIKMIYSNDSSKPTKIISVNETERKKFVLTESEILLLAKWACIIEDHYSNKRKCYTPMDMEWAKDGNTGKLFIVQARPETVTSQRDINTLEEYQLIKHGPVLITGSSVGERIGKGKARIIKNVKGIHGFKKGEVLVTDMTDPDWEPIMKIASAIVTNRGGRTCHAAIISRELGIPCLVGTNHATEAIKNKQMVTVSCAEGEMGFVYKGNLPFKIKKTNLKTIPKTRTKIMMNVGNPEEAFNFSFIPNDGVGLAREEFIINSYIKIHPMALIHFDKIKDSKTRKIIKDLTYNYKDKKQFFIDELARGVGTIAAAFYPKDVIVRLSDFKTNEYASLIGGKQFEPKEDNPMIGWRGASRYYKPGYKEAFVLECKAMKKAREEFGLNNIKLMVPFCRTINEGKKVIKIMAQNGLKKGKNKLELYVMCEVPSNVILADDFAKIFDGFSIGSNDLTQLTLGVDRDSEILSDVYDEQNQAVKDMVSIAITHAKKNKRKIGICGQAPSDFPEFAQFLVKQNIDSISLNPDTVLKTRLKIAEAEKK